MVKDTKLAFSGKEMTFSCRTITLRYCAENAWPNAPERLKLSIQDEPEPVLEAVVIDYLFEWERFSSFN